MTETHVSYASRPETEMPLSARMIVLVAAFLGWMCAGVIMVIIPLCGREATISFLGPGREADVGTWFARYICAFLLGAAAGGLLFGWLGDRIGRARAMGLSILCYSIVTGVTYFVQSPTQLMILRFIACMGVGGMWPNGISLASEAWSGVSRPLLAGLIGTSANLGFVLLARIASYKAITPDDWRWVMIAGSIPAFLGMVILFVVPESRRWLAARQLSPSPRVATRGTATRGNEAVANVSPVREVFRPPLLSRTVIGICLGTIPLLGNWGGGNWLVPWAGKVGESPQVNDAFLKGRTQTARSAGGAIGALLGGWIASLMGRRKAYFLFSITSLAATAHVFHSLTPLDASFLFWVFVVGFVGTIYFGWLPLYLPELFPTRVRATGSGVSFNFGRLATAAGVLGVGTLMQWYDGDYARVGQITSLTFALGMIVICFAPDTSKKQLED